jgi:hypothetical protein
MEIRREVGVNMYVVVRRIDHACTGGAKRVIVVIVAVLALADVDVVQEIGCGRARCRKEACHPRESGRSLSVGAR